MGLWGVGPFFGPLIWDSPKRGLNEEWAKVGPWARGQIDTSIGEYGVDLPF